MLVRCQIADYLGLHNMCVAPSCWLRERFQFVLVAGHMTCLGREGETCSVRIMDTQIRAHREGRW